MKGLSTLVTFQALLATICGVLISQMSWIGKVGIQFFYKDYSILKEWWKTAILVFLILLIFILVFYIFKRILSRRFSFIIYVVFLIIGGIGAYITYDSFQTGSYKLMRNHFHFGFYLFWIGWAINCFYFMLTPIKSHKEEKPFKTEYET